MSTRTRNRPLATAEGNSRGQQAVSTGSLALDLKLGAGGWPRGRIVEVYGPEGCGKTTLLLEAIAHVQHNGGMGAFIDADHATDQATAARLGIDLEKMPFVRTNGLEEAFVKIEELVLGGAVDVVALDSIAALLPSEHRTCQDAPYRQNETHQYRVDHYLKVLLGPLSRSRAVLLISNQLRDKIGVMYGSPETTPWVTLPLKDYASVRVDLRKTSPIKLGEQSVGIGIRAKIVKNRLAAPLTQAEFEMYFDRGICVETELLTLGVEAGLLRKRGNWFYQGDDPLGNGSLAAAAHLRQHTELAAELRAGIIERLRPPVEADPATQPSNPSIFSPITS
jgi:recombination protein RecA